MGVVDIHMLQGRLVVWSARQFRWNPPCEGVITYTHWHFLLVSFRKGFSQTYARTDFCSFKIDLGQQFLVQTSLSFEEVIQSHRQISDHFCFTCEGVLTVI